MYAKIKIYHLGGIHMDKKNYKPIDWSQFKVDSNDKTVDEISTYFSQEVLGDNRKLYSNTEIICINR